MTNSICFTKSTFYNKRIHRLLCKYTNLMNEFNRNEFYIEIVTNGIIYVWKNPETRLQSIQELSDEDRDMISHFHERYPNKHPFLDDVREILRHPFAPIRIKVEINPEASLKDYYTRLVKHGKSIHTDIRVTFNGSYIDFVLESEESFITYINMWAYRVVAIQTHVQKHQLVI